MAAIWLHDFAHPPVAARPIPFWSWNETLEPEEIRRQIGLLADAGWGGALLHARSGLRSTYLGEEWFRACAVAIEECRRLGLQVWFYDEEGWPSGISGGSVPLADPAFRQKVLFARPSGGSAPAGSVALGDPVDGLQVYHWTAPLGSWRFNGACFADLLSREAVARFLDDAYASYHRRFAADYGSTVMAEFLDEPCAVVHVQVPSGALPWTDELFATYQQEHGYDVLPHLHLLFTDGPDAARIRIHYARAASLLFERNFTKQLGEWCCSAGIALTGHFMEGGLYEQQALGNRIPPNYRHQDLPGIDHLGLQISEVVTAKQCHAVVNQYAKPQMLCEAYGAAGQHLGFAERWWIGLHLLSLGVTRLVPHLALYSMAGCRKRDFPPNLFHQQPWWPMNAAVDEPLTRLGVALSQGRALAEAVVLHPQDSAAALFCVRSDWADPAALDGGSTVTSSAIRERIERIDRDFQDVVQALLSSQRVFDLGDEVILGDIGCCAMQGGRPVLCVGAMNYPAVILPTMLTLAPTTLRLLQEFHAMGGAIICAGEPPALLDGRPSQAVVELMRACPRVTPDALTSALSREVPPLVQLTTTAEVSHVYVQIRELPEGERLVFIADRRRSGLALAVTVHLAGGYQDVHQLDPFTGAESRLAQAQAVPLILHPATAYVLRLSPTQDFIVDVSEPVMSLASAPPASAPLAIHLAPAAWTVERLDDNALTLDVAWWREAPAMPFTTTAIPVVAIQGRLDELRYRGPLALRYPFSVAGLSPGRRVHVVIEYPERYRITVNGVRVDYAGLPAYRDLRFLPIDISGLVHPGDNQVELELEEFRYAESSAPRERQADRTGTEIEAIYLIGDFQVTGEQVFDGPAEVVETIPFPLPEPQTIPPLRLDYLRAGSLAIGDPRPLRLGNSTVQGLPFYAGRLRLTTTLPHALNAGVWRLSVGAIDAAVAEVAGDGRVIGSLFHQPLSVSIPSGTTELSITLYSTLRNLLGPHHHEAGDPINTAPWYFLPYCGDGLERAENTLAWAQGRFRPRNHRESYASVGFGRCGPLVLASTGDAISPTGS